MILFQNYFLSLFQVGCFDPYSDDPRLAVKKVSLCAVSGTLAVAGTSGHIIIAKLSLTAAENSKIKVTIHFAIHFPIAMCIEKLGVSNFIEAAVSNKSRIIGVHLYYGNKMN